MYFYTSGLAAVKIVMTLFTIYFVDGIANRNKNSLATEGLHLSNIYTTDFIIFPHDSALSPRKR